MPVKKATKKTARKKAKTAAKKPAPKKRVPKPKKGLKYECGICGYRIVVDELFGCATEHVFICCNEPMKRKRAARKKVTKKTTKKKA